MEVVSSQGLVVRERKEKHPLAPNYYLLTTKQKEG